MNTLSTHVLDTSLGRPASGIRVRLERVGAADQTTVGAGSTDANGRLADLVGPNSLTAAPIVCGWMSPILRARGAGAVSGGRGDVHRGAGDEHYRASFAQSFGYDIVGVEQSGLSS
jgi:hypothetical protein